MPEKESTKWHLVSYFSFVNEALPQILSEKFPLVGYAAEETGTYTMGITFTISEGSTDITMKFDRVVKPDGDGLFKINDCWYIVVPLVDGDDLDNARVSCVGEQLSEYVRRCLHEAYANHNRLDLEYKKFFPLDTWIREFVENNGQDLDTTNWISRNTHLRRIIVHNSENMIASGQWGRVCPFEVPQVVYPDKKVFSIAEGARIGRGKIEKSGRTWLGFNPSVIPFIEYNSPENLMSGSNLMRQSFEPPDPEPALVQTGNEPDDNRFWIGRNILTAFISYGSDTCYRGIVISESCAERLYWPYPVEAGDKISNRHGAKGVISRILPDDAMPFLPDGTPIELIYNFSELHKQKNFGQVLEAVAGRVAGVLGKPVIIPPLDAPDRDKLKEMLVQTGLPENGMERLKFGKDGKSCSFASVVGWVYWFRNVHTVRRLSEYLRETGANIKQGEMENHTLFGLGAHNIVKENLLTRACGRVTDDELRQCVVSGSVEQIAEETPMFKQLKKTLSLTGISVERSDKGLQFGFKSPDNPLTLAVSVPHPWIMDKALKEIGRLPGSALCSKIEETNDCLLRMIQHKAPPKLMENGVELLEKLINRYFNKLLTPESLILSAEIHFSTRAVAAPGTDLKIDQVGIPEDMAWSLFGPLVLREIKDKEAVDSRNGVAGKVLDRIMSETRLIVNRPPTLTDTAFMSFHSVRNNENVIRIHPMVCSLLNLDFDGDQVAVMLPITKMARKEADKKLSVRAHLERDPELLKHLLPPSDSLWGLIHMSCSRKGYARLTTLAGVRIELINGHITRDTILDAMGRHRKKYGVEKTLNVLADLTDFGFAEIQASGASISPFPKSHCKPTAGTNLDKKSGESRKQYREQMREYLFTVKDFENNGLGPQLIFLHAQPDDSDDILNLVLDKDFRDEDRSDLPSLAAGLTPDQLYNGALDTQIKLIQHHMGLNQLVKDMAHRNKPNGHTVLARAFRSDYPGIVFARAAADGAVDPLTDRISQVFVGMGRAV